VILKKMGLVMNTQRKQFAGGKAVADKKYREKNKEKIKQQQAKNNTDEQKEKRKEYLKEYNAKNREYIKLQRRKKALLDKGFILNDDGSITKIE
jgi:hypothetical protein